MYPCLPSYPCLPPCPCLLPDPIVLLPQLPNCPPPSLRVNRSLWAPSTSSYVAKSLTYLWSNTIPIVPYHPTQDEFTRGLLLSQVFPPKPGITLSGRWKAQTHPHQKGLTTSSMAASTKHQPFRRSLSRGWKSARGMHGKLCCSCVLTWTRWEDSRRVNRVRDRRAWGKAVGGRKIRKVGGMLGQPAGGKCFQQLHRSWLRLKMRSIGGGWIRL